MSPVNAFIGSIGGRKFVLAVFALAAVVFQARLGIDITPYQNLILGVVGTFIVGQGLADGLSGGATSTYVAHQDSLNPEPTTPVVPVATVTK